MIEASQGAMEGKIMEEVLEISQEVVKEIKIVDSSHNFVPLEKQIAMFPEAGQLLV